MRSIIQFLVVALLLSGCTAIGAATTHATTDLSTLADKTPAGIYHADVDHTSVHFKVRHFNFSTFVGRFNAIEAELNWNPAAPEESTLVVEIDTASIDTGVPALDDLLRAASMFDAANHPPAKFVSTQIILTGDATGEVLGDLTVKGRTRPLTFNVTFNGGDVNGLTGKPTLGFSATADMPRSQWGLGQWYPVVGGEVRLEIEAEFVAEDE